MEEGSSIDRVIFREEKSGLRKLKEHSGATLDCSYIASVEHAQEIKLQYANQSQLLCLRVRKWHMLPLNSPADTFSHPSSLWWLHQGSCAGKWVPNIDKHFRTVQQQEQ